MTPKEKAAELFSKMFLSSDGLNKYPMCYDTAKQCALFAVEELLEVTHDACKSNTYLYWEQVKEEIEAI